MEVCISTLEKLKIIYKASCPMCGKGYNSKSKKQDFYHIIPLFMKPAVEIELSICKKCHEEINLFYDKEMIRKKTGGKEPKNIVDFQKFLLQFRILRKKFKDNEINKGVFGEGLWKNLVNHLHYIDDNIDFKTEVKEVEKIKEVDKAEIDVEKVEKVEENK